MSENHSDIFNPPFVPKHGRNYLTGVAPAKQSELVAAFIAAAKHIGDTYYSIDQEEVRESYAQRLVEEVVENVSSHMGELMSGAREVEIIWEDSMGMTQRTNLPVQSQASLPGDLADALLESYRSLTAFRPASINAAIFVL